MQKQLKVLSKEREKELFRKKLKDQLQQENVSDARSGMKKINGLKQKRESDQWRPGQKQ